MGAGDGLMSWGDDIAPALSQAADDADQIIKDGLGPGNLPAMRPVPRELFVSRSVATNLGFPNLPTAPPWPCGVPWQSVP